MTCVEFFGRVLRLKLTAGQTAFVAVAIDKCLPRDLAGPVRDAAIEMFGDVDELSPLALRTVVAAMGRDSGKTQLAAGIGLFLMMTADVSRCGPGDLPLVGVVAPREKTAKIALRRASALVQRAPELRKRLVTETKDGFVLKRHDGRQVGFEVFAASRGGASLRGPSFIAIIFDEAAQFRDESAAVNDEALYAAVMPRVIRLALFLSTPWAMEGLFWKLSNENAGAPRVAVVAKASTLLMRDHDEQLAAAIAVERDRDFDNCEREFFAQFMATGGSLFFDGKAIEDAIDDALVLPVPLLDGEIVGCGADVGLVRDSSAIVAVGASGPKRERLRVVNLLELRPTKHAPLKLSEVVRDFAGVCSGYGVGGFYADGHAREPAREHASEHMVEIWPRPEGPTAKFDLHVAVRQAFNDRRIAIPRHPRLLAQLRSVTLRPVPGGAYKISSPRRVGLAHGDLVAALTLGLHAASEAFVRLPGERAVFTIRGDGSRWAGYQGRGWG